VIERGEPAIMVCHWTGIYWNGEERGLRVFQEVERRLRSRYADRILWMKLSEVARYWAARELTQIESVDAGIRLRAPFACPSFTVSIPWRLGQEPVIRHLGRTRSLKDVTWRRDLRAGKWHLESKDRAVACFDLPKGESELVAKG